MRITDAIARRNISPARTTAAPPLTHSGMRRRAGAAPVPGGQGGSTGAAGPARSDHGRCGPGPSGQLRSRCLAIGVQRPWIPALARFTGLAPRRRPAALAGSS